MIRTVRREYTYLMPSVAIALVLSFVVHDVERTHEHPFAPYAHSHEQYKHHHEQKNGAALSVYIHSDRKDFLALLLLIAVIPVTQLLFASVPPLRVTLLPSALRYAAHDYHRLLFRKGILNPKLYYRYSAITVTSRPEYLVRLRWG